MHNSFGQQLCKVVTPQMGGGTVEVWEWSAHLISLHKTNLYFVFLYFSDLLKKNFAFCDSAHCRSEPSVQRWPVTLKNVKFRKKKIDEKQPQPILDPSLIKWESCSTVLKTHSSRSCLVEKAYLELKLINYLMSKPSFRSEIRIGSSGRTKSEGLIQSMSSITWKSIKRTKKFNRF